ncbi:MAG TPA: hypothetical protein DEA08_14355 [Planctomycetes bacterium]|nr:hypothetical protein [Planctomycetota bacterium]
MLARLNDHDAIATSYLSSDGTQLLLQGAPDATREQVLAACEEGLRKSNLRPQPQPTERASQAWDAREGDGWLAHGELWKLSWREAEAFADRILAVLVEEHGQGVRPLRPLLVESCFEGVRPHDGSGPTPSRWEKGASVEVRRVALLKEARKHLSEDQVAQIGEFLADGERIRAILRPKK